MQANSTSNTPSATPALPVAAAPPQARGEGAEDPRFADVLQGRRAAARKGTDDARGANAAATAQAPEHRVPDAAGKDGQGSDVDAGDASGAAAAAAAAAATAAPGDPALTPPPANAANDILAMLRGDPGYTPADPAGPGFASAAPILRQMPGDTGDQIVLPADLRGNARATAGAGADARPMAAAEFPLPAATRAAPAPAPGTPRADAGVSAASERPGATMATARPSADTVAAGSAERTATAADNARPVAATPAPDGRTDTLAWLNANAAAGDVAAARPAAAAVHSTSIEAPVGSPKFADAAASQVTWMAKNGIEQAEIRVKPAELGPISVRIEMQNNEAVISFAVTQPETRAAVEDSLHKLQEMLADSGIALGQTSVGGQGFHDQARDGTAAARHRVTFAAAGASDAASTMAGARQRPLAARGLVDTFA